MTPHAKFIHRLADIRGVKTRTIRKRLRTAPSWAVAVYGAIKSPTINANRYKWNGGIYTTRQLAEMRGITPHSMHGRIKRLGVDKAMDFKEQRGQVYVVDGQEVTSKVIAKKYDCTPTAVNRNIRLYGIEKAIEIARKTYERRQERLARPQYMPKKKSPRPKSADPDIELKRRIEQYRARGWSDDEILMKLRAA